MALFRVIAVCNRTSRPGAVQRRTWPAVLALLLTCAGCAGPSTPISSGRPHSFLYAANRLSHDVTEYRLDPATGKLTLLGHIATGAYPRAVVVAPQQHALYVANEGSDSVSQYHIRPDGGLTPFGVPQVAAGTSPDALVVSARTHCVYVANLGDNTVRTYQIRPDGTLKPMGSIRTGRDPTALALSHSEHHLYVAALLDNSLSVYDVGRQGHLHPAVPQLIRTGGYPAAIAFSHSGPLRVRDELAGQHRVPVPD